MTWSFTAALGCVVLAACSGGGSGKVAPEPSPTTRYAPVTKASDATSTQAVVAVLRAAGVQCAGLTRAAPPRAAAGPADRGTCKVLNEPVTIAVFRDQQTRATDQVAFQLSCTEANLASAGKATVPPPSDPRAEIVARHWYLVGPMSAVGPVATALKVHPLVLPC